MVDDAQGASTSQPRNWTRILSNIASVAGLLSLALSVWVWREARASTEASGELKKAKIVFGFGKYSASKRDIDVLAVISRRCQRRPVLMDIPLMLANQGDKVASDVSMSLEFPLEKGASFAGSSEMSNSFERVGPPVTNIKRSVTDADTRRYVSFNIDKIYPRTLAQMIEPVVAPMPIDINIHELDRRFTGTIKFGYSLQIPISIVSDGELTVAKMTISTIIANNMKDAQPQINNFMRSKVIKNRRNKGYISKILAWISPEMKEEVFVVYPDDSSCDIQGMPYTQTRNVRSLIYS